jgi:hypothetical protein
VSHFEMGSIRNSVVVVRVSLTGRNGKKIGT